MSTGSISNSTNFNDSADLIGITNHPTSNLAIAAYCDLFSIFHTAKYKGNSFTPFQG